MHGLRLAWSDDNTVSKSFNRKMMDAEKIYAEKIYAAAVKLSASRRSELTQRSQVVSVALAHVHCLLEVIHLLVQVASRCRFVDSSHGPEKTAVLKDQLLSIFQSASCFCLLTEMTYLRRDISSSDSMNQGCMNVANRLWRRSERCRAPNLGYPRAL